eukprot:2438893-Alexandrium_andersonii.AAC.1
MDPARGRRCSSELIGGFEGPSASLSALFGGRGRLSRVKPEANCSPPYTHTHIPGRWQAPRSRWILHE